MLNKHHQFKSDTILQMLVQLSWQSRCFVSIRSGVQIRPPAPRNQDGCHRYNLQHRVKDMTEISSLPWSLAEKAYTIISILPSALDNYIQVAEPTKTATGVTSFVTLYIEWWPSGKARDFDSCIPLVQIQPILPCGNDFPSAVSFSFL